MSDKRKIIWIVIAVFIFSAVINAAAVGLWARAQFDAPGPLPEIKTIVIAKGAGLGQIAGQLESGGVIDHDWLFKIAVLVQKRARQLKPGEYEFAAGQSMHSVIDQIADGKTVRRKFTAAEGMTTDEIIAKLLAADKMDGAIATRPAEGDLLPETYLYQLGDDRAGVIARMQSAMQTVLADAWPKRAANLPISKAREAVILASIVEKETAKPEERTRIAAVYVNRLRIGMPLQADPTVRYAMQLMGRDLSDGLTYDHLRTPHPYNTYVNPGLPPGPICNPGRDSILAVLNPLVTNELFFVADGTGGHAFATNLDAHNRNVAVWRRINR